MKLFFLMVLLLKSLSTWASVGNWSSKDSRFFTKVGVVDSFQWAPERYGNNFKYDIFYYIPSSLKKSKNFSALIFKHGGGASTATREGSINTIKLYMPDLKKIAEELGIMVVLPSANGLNWGGHTRGLLRDLARLMRTNLPVDPNKIGVSGHSMGGMGITRNYLWGADEFAFFLPMAAGMDEKHQNEKYLNKVFNVPYVHLQGRKDHFTVFIQRCMEQLNRTKELETAYQNKSKLEIVFYDGDHNYDYDLFKSNLKRLFSTSPRDLYQKKLWGTLHSVKTTRTENKISYDYDSEIRYFWVELADVNLSQPEETSFYAEIVNQKIFIEMLKLPTQSKKLKVYLHSSMINLEKSITVYLNGKVVKKRIGALGKLKSMDPLDPGFKFEDVIEIKL